MKVASYRLGQYDKETGTLIEGPMKDPQTGKYLEFHNIEESNRYLKERFKDEPEKYVFILKPHSYYYYDDDEIAELERKERMRDSDESTNNKQERP